MLREKKGDASTDNRSCHGGAALFCISGLFRKLVVAACDLVTGGDNVRFFDAERCRANAGIGMLAVVPYRDDFAAVARRAYTIRIWPHISRGCNDDDAHVPQLVYFFYQSGLLVESFVVGGADGKVYNIDAETQSVFYDPIDAGNHMRDHALTFLVENFHGYDAGLRCHATVCAPAQHAVSGSNAGNVCSVPVVIVGSGFGVYDIVPPANPVAKIRMIGYSAVEDGNTAAFASNSVGMTLVCINDLPHTIHCFLNSGNYRPSVSLAVLP